MKNWINPLLTSHSNFTYRDMVRETMIAVSPAVFFGVWRYGYFQLLVYLSVWTGISLISFLFKIKPNMVEVLIAILLTMMLPVSFPLGLAFVAGALCSLARHYLLRDFDGINMLNPAVFSWCMLAVLCPAYILDMGNNEAIDALSGATLLQNDVGEISAGLRTIEGVTLGTVSPFTLVLGGLYLIWRKVIDFRVPLYFLSLLALLAMIWPSSAMNRGHGMWVVDNAIVQVLGGGSILGAFFMLTDPVTSPMTRMGKVAFACLAAFYTMMIRRYTLYVDGVAFAILLTNLSNVVGRRLHEKIKANPPFQT